MAGKFSSNQQVILHDMLLPEICQDITIPELQACVFATSCWYDIIAGRNALHHFQIILDFNNNIIESSTFQFLCAPFQPTSKDHNT